MDVKGVAGACAMEFARLFFLEGQFGNLKKGFLAAS
jgi:hypothetical protein